MKKIKEICKEIVNKLHITVPENVKPSARQFKMSDIMPKEEWITPGVTCLAARPGMGKTALAIELALDAALWMEKPIVFFSPDMDENQLVYRMLKNITGIQIPGELQENDMPRLATAIAYIEKLNIFIDDTPGIAVSEIEAKLQEQQDVGMVVIDYIQLVTGAAKHFRNGHDDVQWVVQNISRITEARQIPVLLLSHLPRTVEYRFNKRPCLEDMYYGVYARDVDQVIFLYREKVYCQQTRDDSAEIIIAKSKSGISKTVQVLFNEKHLRFENK